MHMIRCMHSSDSSKAPALAAISLNSCVMAEFVEFVLNSRSLRFATVMVKSRTDCCQHRIGDIGLIGDLLEKSIAANGTTSATTMRGARTAIQIFWASLKFLTGDMASNASFSFLSKSFQLGCSGF